MDTGKGEVRIKKGTGPLGVCPYLGVQDDAATHYAWAGPGHFCYRVRPPQAINVGHQENSCLNGRYPTCVVYPASFSGPLPPEVRDDTYTDWGTRAAVIKSSITNIGASQRDTVPVEKSTARFGVDLSALRDQAEFVEEEEEEVPAPWWSSRKGKIALIALIALPILILSTWAVIMTTRASQDAPPTQPAPQVVDLTATWQAAFALLPDATNTPTEVPVVATSTPEPTTTSTPTPTQLPPSPTQTANVKPSETPGPSPTSTNTVPPLTCDDIGAFTLDLVEGPILTPVPGYIYNTGNPLPPIRSTWVIRNTGVCTWDEIFLRSQTSKRLLNPFLRVNGQLIIPFTDQSDYLIAPGEKVEILLGFTPDTARSIRSDWDLVINGFELKNQPPLSIDVHNWVINGSPGSGFPTDDRPAKRPKPPAPTAPSIRP